MSNHRQGTAGGPSQLSIAGMAVVTGAAIWASVWILAEPGPDNRDITGAILGMLLALVLTAQTVVRASERAEALRRRAERRRRYLAGAGTGWPDPVATQPVAPDDTWTWPPVVPGERWVPPSPVALSSTPMPSERVKMWVDRHEGARSRPNEHLTAWVDRMRAQAQIAIREQDRPTQPLPRVRDDRS